MPFTKPQGEVTTVNISLTNILFCDDGDDTDNHNSSPPLQPSSTPSTIDFCKPTSTGKHVRSAVLNTAHHTRKPPPCTHMHTHAHTRTHNAHILILLLRLEHTLGPRPVSHAVLHNGRLRLASRWRLRVLLAHSRLRHDESLAHHRRHGCGLMTSSLRS